MSNLNETIAGNTSLGFPIWLAQSFTTGASNYTLDAVNLLISESINGNVFFDLYTDNNGDPGSVFANLSPTAPITSGPFLEVNEFTPNSTTTLTPNTTYWVVGGSTVNGSAVYNWSITDSTNEIGIDGWTIDESRNSGNQGGTWSSRSDRFQMSIDATDNVSVPEPGSLVALLGLGGLGLTSRLKKYK